MKKGKQSGRESVLLLTIYLQNPMVYVLREMLLKNYKRKYCLGNCVFYFLKVKYMFFLIQYLTFLSTFISLTSALGHRLTRLMF